MRMEERRVSNIHDDGLRKSLLTGHDINTNTNVPCQKPDAPIPTTDRTNPKSYYSRHSKRIAIPPIVVHLLNRNKTRRMKWNERPGSIEEESRDTRVRGVTKKSTRRNSWARTGIGHT